MTFDVMMLPTVVVLGSRFSRMTRRKKSRSVKMPAMFVPSMTINDPALTEQMLPTLQRVAGSNKVILFGKITGAEDFSFFAQKAPGLFIFLGGSPAGTDLSKVAYNHSPRFQIDESALNLGVRTMTQLTLDYMEMNAQ